MSHDTTIAPSCLSRLFQRLRFNALSRDTSSSFSTPARTIAQISAAGLVLASAGFGAVYAWTTGVQHGYALACLMVLMAVALELIKPLSLAAAFSAFRSWSIVRGAALTLLALVAIAYSLTAELSLMATTHGDVVATREASIKAVSGFDAEIKRARDSYERAKSELDTLPASKPSSEFQAEIDGLLLTPGADGCVAINGKVTRDVCPKVARLRTDKARADRRAELEQIVSKPLPTSAPSQQTVSKSDPAASALSAYLAFFGVTVPAALLSEWLVLVGVLALEVGSAMAGVLAQSFAGPARAVLASANRKEPVVQPPAKEPAVQVVQARPIEVSEMQPTVREEVKNRIVKQLKANGGSKVASERGLAKLIGTSKPTARRALQSLVMAGVIAAEATRNGTMLRLIT